MKNLFILIALLMTHLTLSQTINTTKKQKERISKILTPEKIIEISKGLSNEIRQDSVISARDIQIAELQSKIEALKEEHKNTLISIAKENNKAKEASQEEDKLSDDILKKERSKYLGLHLYIGSEVPKFNFQAMNFNTEVMYELEKFDFGIKAEAIKLPTQHNYNFNYSLKIRYKIF